MDFELSPFGVYIKTDDKGRITAINSDAFLPSLDGWVKIGEGYGDKHHHAQGNYLPSPLMDERGLYCWKLQNGSVDARTKAEMDADYVKPEEKPTIESRVETVEGKTGELEEALEMLLSGVTE